ncbi:hypothetical protein COLO4_30851 [Corchorus olitorius]|uniref:Uncharacterized protein n=1 Tax=Corchorus olitorius TaxID=93759 RepID=A0A1R3H6J5_9ROSI|nr:hypothetical protein COLO4_30851 [Corchorus olitorius]
MAAKTGLSRPKKDAKLQAQYYKGLLEAKGLALGNPQGPPAPTSKSCL